MRKEVTRYLQCYSGAVAVEYALLLPVLAVLLVGVIDVGKYIHHRMMVQELSRAAAQYVVQGGNPEKVEADVFTGSVVAQRAAAEGRVVRYTSTKECECNSGATVSCSSGKCPAGDYIRSFVVSTVESDFAPLLPYPGFPEKITLRGYSRMQYDG